MNPNGVIKSVATDGDGVRRKVLNDLREPVKDYWFADFKNFEKQHYRVELGSILIQNIY
jgi:hypothetical protein